MLRESTSARSEHEPGPLGFDAMRLWESVSGKNGPMGQRNGAAGHGVSYETEAAVLDLRSLPFDVAALQEEIDEVAALPFGARELADQTFTDAISALESADGSSPSRVTVVTYEFLPEGNQERFADSAAGPVPPDLAACYMDALRANGAPAQIDQHFGDQEGQYNCSRGTGGGGGNGSCTQGLGHKERMKILPLNYYREPRVVRRGNNADNETEQLLPMGYYQEPRIRVNPQLHDKDVARQTIPMDYYQEPRIRVKSRQLDKDLAGQIIPMDYYQEPRVLVNPQQHGKDVAGQTIPMDYYQEPHIRVNPQQLDGDVAEQILPLDYYQEPRIRVNPGLIGKDVAEQILPLDHYQEPRVRVDPRQLGKNATKQLLPLDYYREPTIRKAGKGVTNQAPSRPPTGSCHGAKTFYTGDPRAASHAHARNGPLQTQNPTLYGPYQGAVNQPNLNGQSSNPAFPWQARPAQGASMSAFRQADPRALASCRAPLAFPAVPNAAQMRTMGSW